MSTNRSRPVPKKDLENLRTLLLWLYGSNEDDIKPVITSQNPDIKNLAAVLSHPRSRTMMLARNNLAEAHSSIEPRSARFESALVNAKQDAETALSQIIGYDSEDSTLLEIGKDLVDTSEQLYITMESMAKRPRKGRNNPVLAVPDESDHRAKFADWLELKAISSPDARHGFGTLISAAELTENEQDNNIAEQDAKEDRLVQAAQEEIERRLASVGKGYPVRIDPRSCPLLRDAVDDRRVDVSVLPLSDPGCRPYDHQEIERAENK